mmetsp:Transcript_21364/g.45030  ORF Transcript_21364/g.45030 Transcript_21364/m.45030 type:complete len:289 (+) Transcript_21364:109-975(+)|eukprot:CAMPEP_0201251436 /NCGR_PEP_ID=MMETSP0852-20130820/66355_1 /ASSEMBLY_ACC=CAM_ASM_000632 /TAXON_ID=183588 /ORGANISM="Pseudo-nitzschia fraudulenta, Strain WWA7" /LENGTH=288 /DNA_ID=CAMNT_0047551029 /DNA_START=71 /DNA_END=937 /DNA_ORIENTATION=-
MARKSKQPGGHNPLTAHERKKYAKDAYGTTTARLGQDSQYTFASCGLSLHPARDRPVATPSGYIYERSSMLEYMLTKTQELKRKQQEYDEYLSQTQASLEGEENKKRKSQVEEFESAQKVTSAKKRKVETNVLKRTSYWLADMQPDNDDIVSSRQRTPPPKRPPSPNTKRPLRRKDLIELELKRSNNNANKIERGNNNDHVLCAISEKEISTQQAVALVTKGNDLNHRAQVVLEKVYNDLNIEKEKVRICPVTGRKIKQVLKLQRGGSSFASTDGRVVEAKQYRPTMT